MTVYLVESGCYEQRYISGVFASVEAAIAANPIPPDFPYPDEPSPTNGSRRGGWRKVEGDFETYWTNQLDWDSHADIYAYEVQEAIVK